MLPDGFHQWFGGGGHIPVIDPGPAQDATLITCDIVSTFGPGGPIKAAQGARRIRAITTAAAVTSGPRKTRQISTATKVASGPRKQRIIKTAADEAAEKSAKSTRKIRREWEDNHNKKWPKDKDGNNQDAHHKKPRADGGTDDIDNIEPMPHDEHMEHHMENGDFKRWGSRPKGG